MKNKDLKRRIIEISYKNKLSHIGSCLTAVDIIEEIYSIKKPDEKFVLSSGHAGLGLYVVLEKLGYGDAETFLSACGIHPDRYVLEQSVIDWASSRVMHPTHGIDCSAGSLGQGLPIAVGMALSDRSKNVFVLCSDGEMQEGSCYEALQVANEQKLTNLKVYINCNGFGAYKKLERDHLVERCRAFTNVDISFRQTNFEDMPKWFNGQQAHYLSLNEDQYKELNNLYER